MSGIVFSQQGDSLNTKNPRFIVKMTHGMANSVVFDFTRSQWDKMTPGFEIPDSLTTGFNGVEIKDNIHTTSSNQYYLFSFSLINGAAKQPGRKFLATTTFHLGYGPELRAENRWYHEDREIIDTLTSSQNGQEYYVYGNRNQTIAKRYTSKSIVFGVGEHIATNPNRLFQFETGFDLLCMLSIVSEVRASYLDSYLLEGLPNEGQGYAYPQPLLNETKAQTFSNKLTSGVIMRVPLEMSFKLSRKSPVASRMRLGAELNPGLATVFTGGLITTNFNITGGMNFRFAF
ncbi:hypothetical protein FO442_02645 [Fluviicola chungangensis]|uniref:Uncharacterized protein n=2 Tax=Fluviicola chungangensis TaxID=2597671 RepID=A0A556N7Q1_9FLAO|nr:hypothetical protein FO442_02645 [Fluviicola chungangensis]